MGQVNFWRRAIRSITSRTTFRGIMTLAAFALCVGSGLGTSARRVNAQIDPKLREQVLQIIRENPEVILEAVQAYQRKEQQQQSAQRQAFLQQLKNNPKAVIGQSPTKGANNGKLVLIEFSDFQCPFCARTREPLQQFLAKYPDHVTLVYKHFPLVRIHKEALPAAKAAWAAGQQGKFWEFHDALFTHQERLGEDFYLETAKALGLDLQKFNRDRTSAAAIAAITQDMQLAEKLGIDGTPFFVTGDRAFSGAVQLSDLEALLNQ
jgi:protein-disulfide isomerase